MALKDNKAAIVAKILYYLIMCKSHCPMEIVSDQGVHFINKVIKLLFSMHTISHKKSYVYYPQVNGQDKSTNKF